jgi:hypothetical protein
MSEAVKGELISADDASVLIVPLDDRLVVWFDIDNTLYSANVRIAEKMSEKIHGGQPFQRVRPIHRTSSFN